jgi:hypothetical protein
VFIFQFLNAKIYNYVLSEINVNFIIQNNVLFDIFVNFIIQKLKNKHIFPKKSTN